MINPVEQFFEYIKNHTGEKLPIAIVVRKDLYEQLMSSPEVLITQTKETNNFLSFPEPITKTNFALLVDPAANDIFMAQTDLYKLFYDQEMLNAYLKRVEDPVSWLRLLCKSANIVCPELESEHQDKDIKTSALEFNKNNEKDFKDKYSSRYWDIL